MRSSTLALGGTLLLAIVLAWAFLAGPLRTDVTVEPSAQATAPRVHEEASLHAPDLNPREAVAQPANPLETHRVAQAESPRPAQPGAPAVPAEATGKLTILVVGKQDGQPMANARVHLVPTEHSGWTSEFVDRSVGKPDESLHTGADGRVEFEVPIDTAYEIEVNSRAPKGRARTSVPALENLLEREVVVRLPTGNDLQFFGKVVAAETGEPLADAHVFLHESSFGSSPRSPDSLGREFGKETKTDAIGYFEVSAPSWDEIHARIECSERSVALAVICAGHETRDTALEIQLQRGAVADVLVLGRSGEALENVDVSLITSSYEIDQAESSANGLVLGDVRWRGVTDLRGECEILDLPPLVPLVLEYKLKGKFDRRDATPLRFEPGEKREIVLRLGEGATIAGSLVERDGTPAKGAEVWLLPTDFDMPRYLNSYERDEARVQKADQLGRFEFEDAADGLWLVGPSPSGPYAPRAEVVSVVQGIPERELAIPAHRGLFIRGVVIDPDGAPVSNVAVHAVREDELGVISDDPSDKSGRFSVGPLLEGEYLVGTIFTPGKLCPSEAVKVRAGAEDVQLQLVLGGILRGSLVDAQSGETVQGDILCHPVGLPSAGTWTRGCPTQEDGSFAIEGIPSGQFFLSAVTKGGLVASGAVVKVLQGDELQGVILRAEPGARLVVRYAGDEPFARVRVLANEQIVVNDGVHNGGEMACVVPAGPIRVECEWQGLNEPKRKELTLQVGEQGEAVFSAHE